MLLWLGQESDELPSGGIMSTLPTLSTTNKQPLRTSSARAVVMDFFCGNSVGLCFDWRGLIWSLYSTVFWPTLASVQCSVLYWKTDWNCQNVIKVYWLVHFTQSGGSLSFESLHLQIPASRRQLWALLVLPQLQLFSWLRICCLCFYQQCRASQPTSHKPLSGEWIHEEEMNC